MHLQQMATEAADGATPIWVIEAASRMQVHWDAECCSDAVWSVDRTSAVCQKLVLSESFHETAHSAREGAAAGERT